MATTHATDARPATIKVSANLPKDMVRRMDSLCPESYKDRGTLLFHAVRLLLAQEGA